MLNTHNISRSVGLIKSVVRMIGKTSLPLTVLLSLAALPEISSASDIYDVRIGLVISGKDTNGNPVEYSYSEDRLLMRARIGTVALNYSYSSRDNLLAYASTDNGIVYTVSRDRRNRISQIVGANSMQMDVTYPGDSVVPSKIQIVKENGQTITPYDQPSVTNSTYSIRSIDQSLSQIYDAYVFSNCMATACPWEN